LRPFAIFVNHLKFSIMKKTTLAIAVATMAVFSFSSCKKDDDSPSRSSMIIGTWKETENGEDTNNNGTWESSEKQSVASVDAVTLVFSGNGTGTINASGFTGTTTWTLLNNDNDVHIVATLPIVGTQTFDFNIVSLTQQNVVVRDTSADPDTYESFTKQ
jgi:hypothetical protein